MRFATRLPNASNESGLGLDTTDFFVSTLVRQDRAVDPVRRQRRARHPRRPDRRRPARTTCSTYGAVGRPGGQQGLEVVGEVNGRVNTRGGAPPVGTDSRGALRVGGRFTERTVRIDAGVIVGLDLRDPDLVSPPA